MFCTTQFQIERRPRRNRKSESIRSLVQETHLLPSDLIYPFFLVPGTNQKIPIPNFPGIYRLSADLIVKEALYLHSQGIKAIALFPVIPKEEKDPMGSFALRNDSFITDTFSLLKKEIPSLTLIADIALDPFTSHGHDGIVLANEVINDATIEVLCKIAVLYAQSGADIVAPSDMMDGRVKYIRKALDESHQENTSILSYTAKYASSLYAPFRDALSSTLAFGDKKTYQMNPANIKEALLEAQLDEEEGADMLLVKPALFYLDVIAKLKERSNLPIGVYHVSGEYAMVMAAAQLGYLDPQKVFYEALLSIKRAGADFIFSYAAPLVLPMV